MRVIPKFALIFSFVVCCVIQAEDDNAPRIVRIEEDWRLEVNVPNESTGAPHVIVQLGSEALGAEAVLTLNYQDAYEFREGGVELQLWSDGILRDSRNSNDGKKLATDNEVITWTQTMKLQEGTIVFAIKDGVSASLGSFGGSEFKVSTPSSLTSFSHYYPLESLKNSGITLGSNRVQLLKLYRLRRVYSDGTVETVAYDKASFYSVSDAETADASGTINTSKTLSYQTDGTYSMTSSSLGDLDSTTTTLTTRTTATLGGADY